MSGDFFQGLLWLSIGAAITLLSSKYNMGTFSAPGPGALPFGLGIVFIVLSGALMFRSWRTMGVGEKSRAPFGPKYRKVLLVLILLIISSFALESLGYLLTLFLLITISMFVMEPRRWLSALLLGASASLFSYTLFDLWLGVSLPAGLLHF